MWTTESWDTGKREELMCEECGKWILDSNYITTEHHENYHDSCVPEYNWILGNYECSKYVVDSILLNEGSSALKRFTNEWLVIDQEGNILVSTTNRSEVEQVLVEIMYEGFTDPVTVYHFGKECDYDVKVVIKEEL